MASTTAVLLPTKVDDQEAPRSEGTRRYLSAGGEEPHCQFYIVYTLSICCPFNLVKSEKEKLKRALIKSRAGMHTDAHEEL